MDRTRRKEAVWTNAGDEADTPGVAVIGLGAVGSSLVRSLWRTRYRLVALVGHTAHSPVLPDPGPGSPIHTDNVRDIPREARLIFICTREDDIPGVVDDLLESDIIFQDAVVAHVSGRETAAILSRLAEKGAETMSFHPLGSFPPGQTEKTFRGLAIGLEGDPLAVAVGHVLAQDLGAEPVEIPRSVKDLYHLAASLTSNYLVTLLADVRQILDKANLPPRLTQSLAADTLLNLGTMEPDAALTGPIVRADVGGLRSQIRTLAGAAPELLSRYLVLAEGTIDLAERSDRISAEESSKLRRILQEGSAP